MRKIWLQILLVISLTSLTYVHAPQAGFMPIDDGSLTYKNPLVTQASMESLTGMFSSYDPELYIPLTLLSYQLDYALGGEDPTVFHITNLLLHLLNAILVLLLVRLWTKKTWLPLLTALLFALHPIHTEAVMWISGRKDLLSATFFLGSLLSYSYYRLKHTRLPYYLSIVLFAGALMSKVVTVTLPLVLIIVDDLMNRTNDRAEKLRKYPYYLLAISFLCIGMFGKSLTIYTVSYFETFLLAAKSAAFSLQKLVLPYDLLPLYQQSLPIAPLTLEFMLPFAILALLYLIALSSRPINKLIAFGILWYGITLVPNLANFSPGSGWGIMLASDRYAYLPSIGILLLIAFGISQLQRKWLAATISCVVITCLMVLTWNQSKRWISGETLFSYVTDRAPQTHVAHAMLGLIDLEAEQYDSAIEHLSRSVELYPNFPDARAHLGLAIIKNGNINGGLAELTQTIASAADYMPAYVYQAYGFILNNDLERSETTLNRVLQLEPNNAKAFQLLGSIAEARGRLEEAQIYYEKSLTLNPRSVQTKAALARLLSQI